ncbi:MAG: hypothetical protein MJ116_12975 [Lachnospiraceae bacterium]|nr:hypothetical protein [Lachnospiraceae bacterium]
MACLVCKRSEGASSGMFSFHVLEVQTLKIRDMGGEKKVQALGRFQDYEVCRSCAEEQVEKNLSFSKTVLPGCIRFGLILLLGVIVSILAKEAATPIRLFGLAAFVCGLFGIYEAIRNGRKHRLDFQTMTKEEALEEAAWELLLANAPKKSEDSDLSYIPVNKKTLSMKNGDLMIAYDLLPEIALKAYDLIRSGD